jgi:hypothetical protein
MLISTPGGRTALLRRPHEVSSRVNQLQWGYNADAEALIQKGLKFADAETAAQFLDLRATLHATHPE